MKALLCITSIILIMTSCKNDTKDEQGTEPVNALPAPASISYNILNTFPHDPSSFTQGLQWYNNALYEGTGSGNTQDPISRLYKVDLKTGKPVQKLDLPGEYFGEGIPILNDTLYQLTWQNRTGFVYDAKTFKKIRTFSYETDGWGLTNDGSVLIMSDGSSNLYMKDPSTFKTLKILGVQDNNGPVGSLNELEYVDGFIYANIWNSNFIIKIDPSNGHVVGKMDFTGVLEQAAKESPDENRGNVLNGIAYDAEKKSFFITGKMWPVMLEVKLQ
jgi:glutamine cyclotransferase